MNPYLRATILAAAAYALLLVGRVGAFAMRRHRPSAAGRRRRTRTVVGNEGTIADGGPRRPAAAASSAADRTHKLQRSLLSASRTDDDDHDDDWAPEGSRDDDPKRLFSHDDWTEYRTERRMSDLQDVLLPMLAALVAYLFWVAMVI